MLGSKVRKIVPHRFSLIIFITGWLVCLSTITRFALLIKSYSSVDVTFLNILGIFLVGFLYDLANAGYFIIPLLLYLWLIPEKIYSKTWHKAVLYGLCSLSLFILLFNAVSEWFFWDEFNARFNFIAVDYLVYTTEVIGNIRQSYPMEWIIALLVAITGVIIYSGRSWIDAEEQHSTHFKQRTMWVLALSILPILSFFAVNNKYHRFSGNAFVNELAGNGMYELFAAYLNNDLDYDQFYKRIDNEASFVRVRALLKTEESEYTTTGNSVERKISNAGPEKKLNVVLISVESLSADFLGVFGNTQHITPQLDSLSHHGLLFTNLYATGTRTVRGLEALSLCVPPTPGQSIVRRPHNEDLFSLGNVFDSKGYESKYIYGGYGYFDNMGYFFSNNGYTVVDRNELEDKDIDYENIWGVADENLFTLAIREIDKTVSERKPIFAHVMTTSNHRPFTYPDGRIDIPSHTNREGAVKYTDYAIGKFLKDVSQKPWFDSTIFIIVADHCASSAGKTELPVNKYHIPMLFYSPANIPPGKMERLMSQIDLGPTLLGMLNFSYVSKFYGYDIFKLEAGRERVFISTYQSLGFITSNKMVILSPQQKMRTYQVNFNDGSLNPAAEDKNFTQDAISWYQSASYAFKNGLMETQEQ
jgi:phosphoglycerol transferase MdoB-like AlkP superfamily enzyme